MDMSETEITLNNLYRIGRHNISILLFWPLRCSGFVFLGGGRQAASPGKETTVRTFLNQLNVPNS